MANKRIPFSEARQNLTSIVDEVEKFGRAVTIVRRGKPAAVIIDPDTYNQFVGTHKRKKWMLKGSIIVKSGVNIDESLAKAKEARIRRWRERRGKLGKLLRES
jgi:prevent-host-death family protein